MISFAIWWVSLAIFTLFWVLLTEFASIKLRGSTAFLQVQMDQEEKKAETGKGPNWVKEAAILLFFWWIMLLVWMWAAYKGRSLLEHQLWMQEDAKRMKEEMVRRREEHKQRMVQALEEYTKDMDKLFDENGFKILRNEDGTIKKVVRANSKEAALLEPGRGPEKTLEKPPEI